MQHFKELQSIIQFKRFYENSRLSKGESKCNHSCDPNIKANCQILTLALTEGYSQRI